MKTLLYTPRCEFITTCEAPPVSVVITDAYHGDSITAELCALHIPDVKRLGFHVSAITGRREVRDYLSPINRLLLDAGHGRIYEEVSTARPKWDAHGCKLHRWSKPDGTHGVTLIHSAAYGCPAGVRW